MHRTRSLSTLIPLCALLVLGTAVPAVAQHEGHGAEGHGMATAEGMPEGWLMRLDRPGTTPDMADFRTMSPGWHLTTDRGSGIFWQPEMTASGEYTASTEIHLMKPAPRPESFGIFVGGRDLDAEDQAYLYFLVRQTGEYLIKRRRGGETETVVEWTAHDAVPTATAGESTSYQLAVDVGADEVEFLVNGTPVHTLPAEQLETDGVVGMRVNHMLDVHVEELDVEAR